MSSKVILCLVDGMRPDAVERCAGSFLQTLSQRSASSMKAATVFPSVTLPCHASLFLGVEPGRHGILENQWQAQVRPIPSLGDLAKQGGKKAAMFYNWEELRDLNRPGSLHYSHFQSEDLPHDQAISGEVKMTEQAAAYIRTEKPDFVFLYLGYTDVAGHHFGWMGNEYLEALNNASRCIASLWEEFGETYTFVITADHGGHDRTHGSHSPEDMTIPIWFCGPAFEAGRALEPLSILDIAPTVAALLELPTQADWDGRSVLDGRSDCH